MDSIFTGIASLFSGKQKPKTLADISLDDLNREKFGAQNDMRKFEAEMDKFDHEEQQYVAEYRAARQTGKDNQARNIGRKLQTLQMQVKGVQQMLEYTNKVYQTLIGIEIFKKAEEFRKKRGLGTILSGMDIVAVQSYIDDAIVDGKLDSEKLDTLLEGLGPVIDSGSEQNDKDILAELDQKYLGIEAPNASVVTPVAPVQKIADDLAALDEIINKGANVAQHLQQPNMETHPQ